jgi:hypothetical protein
VAAHDAPPHGAQRNQPPAHMPADEVFESGNSTLGLVRQASHGYYERIDVCRALLARGHVVAGNWEKILRRPL